MHFRHSIAVNTRRVVVSPLTGIERTKAQNIFDQWRSNLSVGSTKFNGIYKRLDRLGFPPARTGPFLDAAIMMGWILSEIEKQEKTWKSSSAWRGEGESMLPVWPLSPLKRYVATHNSPYTIKGSKTPIHPAILKATNNAGQLLNNLVKNTNKIKALRKIQKAREDTLQPFERAIVNRARRERPIVYLPRLPEQSRRQTSKNARATGGKMMRNMVSVNSSPSNVLNALNALNARTKGIHNQTFFGSMAAAKAILKKMKRSKNRRKSALAEHALAVTNIYYQAAVTAWKKKKGASKKYNAGSDANTVYNNASSNIFHT